MKPFELLSRLRLLQLTVSHIAYVEINCNWSYVYVYVGEGSVSLTSLPNFVAEQAAALFTLWVCKTVVWTLRSILKTSDFEVICISVYRIICVYKSNWQLNISIFLPKNSPAEVRRINGGRMVTGIDLSCGCALEGVTRFSGYCY